MKRKILSLILVLMLLPIASVFGACGKDKSYNLSNLKTDFDQIATDNNNIKLTENQLVFDYSYNEDLKQKIDTTAPYNELKNYNVIFNNLMMFPCSYIDECSNKTVKEEKIKNQVENDLEDLKKAIKDVNHCFNVFAELINISSEDITSTACLKSFETLLKTYNDMFEKSINFNNSLSNLYFNYILNNGNPQVSDIPYSMFDSADVVNRFKSRAMYQLSLLSQCYVEMYVDDSFATNIANRSTVMNLQLSDYSTNVEKLLTVKTMVETEANERANHENNKETFYELAIQAQNIQDVLNNDREKILIAFNEIEYSEIYLDENLSSHDKLCLDIIKDCCALVTEYNNVLSEMINILV